MAAEILTAEGRKKLEDELRQRETVKRGEIAERIRIAREFGDISENSEYDDAKNEQNMNELRINEINQILSNATDAPVLVKNVVGVGSTVTFKNDKGKEQVFTIVGAAEASLEDDKISNEAPFSRAAIGKKKGDTIEYEGPTGRKLSFTITKVDNG